MPRGRISRGIAKSLVAGGVARGVSQIPKGKISTTMPKAFQDFASLATKRIPRRRKAMPMNYKNPKYKPSSGIGVGY